MNWRSKLLEHMLYHDLISKSTLDKDVEAFVAKLEKESVEHPKKPTIRQEWEAFKRCLSLLGEPRLGELFMRKSKRRNNSFCQEDIDTISHLLGDLLLSKK